METLGAINATLQRYLEVVISKVSPDDAHELIKSEHARLGEIEQLEQLKDNKFYRNAFTSRKVEIEHFREALLKAKTYSEFVDNICALTDDFMDKNMILELDNKSGPIMDINKARVILGQEPFPMPDDDDKLTKKSSGRKKPRR